MSAWANAKYYDKITMKLENGTKRKYVLSHYLILLCIGHFRQAIRISQSRLTLKWT